MIERWKNEDESEALVVIDDPPRPGLLRRIVGFIGKTILVLVISALPVFLVARGIDGLLSGELSIWSRSRGLHKLYGNAATVAAWFHIGFGIGGIGYIFREDVKPIFNWSLWLTAVVCLIAGIYRWIRFA